MIPSVPDGDQLDGVIEDFLLRVRAGETPDPSEYAARHPELAEDIRDLFPALLRLERAAPEREGLAPSRPRVPERIGEYTILREIARGGMGIVYEAEQESLCRHVALKVLPSDRGLEPAKLGRFLLEARSAARLHHSHIVPVFGSGEADGTHYYAMQFIAGQPLDEVLKELKRLRPSGSGPWNETAFEPANRAEASAENLAASIFDGSWVAAPDDRGDETRGPEPGSDEDGSAGASGMTQASAAEYFRNVARIGLQVAEALAYAHGEGVLHRDIKPSNLILDLHGDVWVTDFGLAKARDSVDLTEAGDVVGTLRYLAPERFQGASDERTDVYSLGVTLYELSAGDPPFDGSNREVLTRQVLRCMPPRLRRHVPSVPRDLDTIVHKAMAANPGERYASAQRLVEDLRRFLDYRPIQARRSTLPGRLWRWCRRHPGTAVCLAVIGLLLVTVAILAATSARDLRQERNLAVDALAEARLREARSERRSRGPGQRLRSLAALQAAIGMLPEREERGAETDRLRRELAEEAIAALVLLDVEVISRRDAPRTYDPATRRYACRRPGAVDVFDAGRPDAPVSTISFPAGVLPDVIQLAPTGSHLHLEWVDRERHTGIFAATSGTPLFQVRGSRSPRISFTADGHAVFAGHAPDEPEVSVIRTEDGAAVGTIPVPGKVTALQASPRGTEIAIGIRTRDGSIVRVIDRVDPGQAKREIPLPARLRALAWDPDGRRLAIALDDRTLQLRDAATGSRLLTLLTPSEARGVHFSPDGSWLAVTNWKSTDFWDSRGGRRLLSCPGKLEHFTPDGRQAVFASSRGGGRWRLHSSGIMRSFRYPGGRLARPRQVRCSPDGHWWTLAGLRRGVMLQSTSNGESRQFDAGMVQAVAFDPRDESLWTAGSDGVQRWPPTTSVKRDGPRREPDVIANGYCYDVAVVGPRAATISARGVTLLNRTGDGWTQRELGRHGRLRYLDLSPDGRFVATGTWHGRGVKLWDAARAGLIRTRECGTAKPVFSPCGRWLVISTRSEIEVLRAGTWSPVLAIPRSAEDEAPASCAFTADGDHLAYAATSARVRIIRLPTGKHPVSLPELDTDIVAMAFSPDQTRLWVSSSDGVAREWRLDRLADELRALGLPWTGPEAR